MISIHNNLKLLKINQIVRITESYDINLANNGRYGSGTICVIKHIALSSIYEPIFIVEIPIGSCKTYPTVHQEYETVAIHPGYLECL